MRAVEQMCAVISPSDNVDMGALLIIINLPRAQLTSLKTFNEKVIFTCKILRTSSNGKKMKTWYSRIVVYLYVCVYIFDDSL